MFDACTESPMDSPQPIALQQSIEFAATLELIGRPATRRDGVLWINRTLRGGLRVKLASRLQLDSATTDLRTLTGPGSGPVLLSPDHPAPWLSRHGALAVMTPGSLAELDLTPCPDTQRARLYPKWRNRLRHAEASRLRIRHRTMPDDPGHWLFHADALHQIRHRYRSWPASLTLAFAMANPGKARLFTAYEGNRAIAAMLFLLHGQGASYHIGHNTNRGRDLSAHNLLLWRAMTDLSEQGVRRLDLGLIDTKGSEGLARFKLGTGARARALGGTWLWLPTLAPLFRPLGFLDRQRMAPE